MCGNQGQQIEVSQSRRVISGIRSVLELSYRTWWMLSCCSTDSGHVLKVVFGEGDDGEVVPVIAEDIDVCSTCC